ncbi:MAG TPA: formate dehydrogenase accessory protein FdhE [Thermoanaerobaculia bacterium]|nr:formate dehydrogenase accessory protein FdhE [Thermoanaerobaculia bacterium]
MKPITFDAWLAAHPYLEPVGRFCGEVEAAAAGTTARATAPDWEDYAADFGAGVPLLKSVDAEIDLEAAGRAVADVVRSVAPRAPGGDAVLADLPAGGAASRVVDWLLGEDTLAPASPGLLRYLGWTAVAAYLAPVLGPFAAWRDEEKWLRAHCPTCGSLPAMAQLVGSDPGRMRLLACGCCGTRWQYSRTGCPFCESDPRRLTTLAVEGEGGLRIDSCELCKAYLKTYDGQGDEAVLLADWTSLHLDVVAHDRGLRRAAASLYDLESLLPGSPHPE